MPQGGHPRLQRHPGPKPVAIPRPAICPPLHLLGPMSQHCQTGPALAMGPHPNPRLGLLAPIRGSLAPKPFSLWTPEPRHRSPPMDQEENVPFQCRPSTQGRRKLHAQRRPRHSWAAHLGRNVELDTQPGHRPPLDTPFRATRHCKIGPARP